MLFRYGHSDDDYFREKQIEQRQAEKEKERIETKKAKEREFEERMAAINALQEQRKVDLERSIKLKVHHPHLYTTYITYPYNFTHGVFLIL